MTIVAQENEGSKNRVEIVGQAAHLRFDRFDLENYKLFLRAKALPEKAVEYDPWEDRYTLTTHKRFVPRLGLDVAEYQEPERPPLASHLFDYQRLIVERALDARRYAVYADCGLGKTAIFLEFARLIRLLTGGKVLILSPLSIIPQTCAECERFYPGTKITVLQTREALVEWLKMDGGGLAITNYEKLIAGVIPEFRNLAGLIADESSILKSGGGVIKWNLIKSARGIEYKLSCTATPAPNDVMEYSSQASFLERLRSEGEILWTFFTRTKDGKDWIVKPHARKAFYEFMSAWAFYIRSPRRFGFKDNTADLPEPEFFDIPVPATDAQMDFALGIFAQAGSGLFGDKALGVTYRSKLSQAAKGFVYDKQAAGGCRLIPSSKPEVVAALVQAEVAAGRQVLVWTVFDEESRLLSEALPLEGIRTHEVLHGGLKEGARVEMIERFRTGETPVLISKASLLGYGLNFQHCGAMVFNGWDDSYERFYQAVRRAYRYGQTQRLRVYVPCVRELEGGILENVMKKKANFEADAQAQEDCFLEVYRAA